MGETVVPNTIEKAEPPKGKLPVLKVPDAKFLVGRLRAGKTAGLLSSRKREARVGDQQWLVNELKPTGVKSAFVWGVVVQGDPVRYGDLARVPAKLRAGIDRFTREEFSATTPLYYLPLELATDFAEPIELKKPPRGRRFASAIDIAVARKSDGYWDKPHKCKFCPAQAIKGVLWADGRAVISVCDDHEAKAKKIVIEENNDSVTTIRPLPQPGAAAKAEAIEVDKDVAADLERAVALSDALADAAPSFAERTLRFVEGPAETVRFLKDLRARARKVRDLLASIEIEKAEAEIPQGIVAIGRALAKALARVARSADLPKQWAADLKEAQAWLEQLDAIGRELSAAEDTAELGKNDLEAEALEDGGLLVPTQDGGKEKPLAAGNVQPAALALLSDAALHKTDDGLHRFFSQWFSGTDRLAYRGTRREAVVNAEVFVVEEFRRRGLAHRRRDELAEEAEKLKKADDFAPVHASGEIVGDSIALREVLGHCKTFKLRMPLVYLVGGLCNRGETRNDIDLLIKGPLGEELGHALKFRLGRMFPPELSKRIQFLDADAGGPFTNHVELADLVVEMRPEFVLKQMALTKQDNPLLDLPPAGKGPRPSVLQAHFRGKSLHLDLRIQANDHLIGWTIPVARPGKVPEVDTIAEAQRIGRAIKPEGSAFTKPLIAPAKVVATPKSRQPLIWLKIDAEAFDPGEVGATAEKTGVIVAIDRPQAEFGMQKPFSHEYLFSKGKILTGILHVRQLVGRPGEAEEEVEAGRRTRPGQVFWTAWLSKDALPSVLERRAVRTRSMPPDGYSAIPQSLERVTPKEFRYWEKKGAEARRIRDALVESRFFTKDNVKIVDGKFRRVEQKLYLYLPDDDEAPEPFAKRFRDHLAKQPREAKFALSWQFWKGQTAVRAAPSRQVWHLILDSRDGLETWVLPTDPLSGESPISAVETPRKQKDLLAFDGEAEPGARIGGDVLNDTKATPSTIRIQDVGAAQVLEDGKTFKKIRFRGKKLKGVYTLVAEEEDSKLWQLARGQEPGRAISAEKRHESKTITLADGTKLADVQAWDPAKVRDDDDKGDERTQLRPLALFQPMKIASRRTNSFRDPARIRADFATDEQLRNGVWIEPKVNGMRITLQKDADGRVLLLTEEIFARKTLLRNLLDNLPLVKKEAEELTGPYVLDGEFVAVGENGEPVPRRELARFRGKEPVDDAGVRLQFFDILHHPNAGNVTDRDQAKRRQLVKSLLGGRRFKHLKISESHRAETEAQLSRELRWAATQPWSEGAMLKAEDATYSLGGESDLWAKWKSTRSLVAIIYDRDPVEDTPGVWNYSGAVGPVSKAEAKNWKETVKVGRRLYVPVGITANSRLDLRNGDTVIVDALEILYTENPPRSLRWFGPAAIAGATDQEPSTVTEVLELLRPGERKGLVFKRAAEIGPDDLLTHLAPVNAVSKEALVEIRRRLEAEGEQRLAIGIVLEPEVEDSQKDVYSAAEVRRAAEGYARDSERIKIMHQGEPVNDKVTCLGNYLASKSFESGGETVKRDTWLMALSVPDDAIWAAMKSGQLTGLSIGGDAVRTPRV